MPLTAFESGLSVSVTPGQAAYIPLHHDYPGAPGYGTTLNFGANLPVLSACGDVVGVDVSLDALRSIKERPALGLVQAEADANGDAHHDAPEQAV